MIDANLEHHSPEKIKRFQLAQKMIEGNKRFVAKFNNDFKDVAPIKVFDILRKQLEHNNKNRNFYLNAICVTLRLLLEQTFRWLSFTDLSDKEYEEQLKNISEFKPTCHLRYDKSTNSYKIDNIQITGKKVDRWLEESLKDKSKTEHYKTKIMDSIKNISILNRNIHALHKAYLSSAYNDTLEKISEIQDCILNLISDIDLNNEHFKKLNNKIINYIYKRKW